MSKSPEEMAQAMINNLPEKTGKTLAEWLSIAADSNLTKHGELVKHLKSEHAMTHGYANLVAHQFRSNGAEPAPDDLVAAQYSGPKAGLKPIYDAVVEIISELGSDAEISPKKTYVSFRRNKQFALIQPSTRTRVDLGINLKDATAAGRLEASGSFNQMVSHRVRLGSVTDVDHEVKAWLTTAFDAA